MVKAADDVKHLLGRVIGLAPEHQRSDRDANVIINKDNARDGLEPGFWDISNKVDTSVTPCTFIVIDTCNLTNLVEIRRHQFHHGTWI